MQSALDVVLALVGLSFRGLDPLSLEPLFAGHGRELPFDALPNRARHLVAVTALAVRTLWAAYPHRDPRASEGVIAVDEVDLHQDTQVQQNLLSALHHALPEAQWIVTTSSPVVAGSADAHAVLALRPLPEGNTVHVFTADHARTH
jgi:predicted ATP-binding protein involved in virulence